MGEHFVSIYGSEVVERKGLFQDDLVTLFATAGFWCVLYLPFVAVAILCKLTGVAGACMLDAGLTNRRLLGLVMFVFCLSSTFSCL